MEEQLLEELETKEEQHCLQAAVQHLVEHQQELGEECCLQHLVDQQGLQEDHYSQHPVDQQHQQEEGCLRHFLDLKH